MDNSRTINYLLSLQSAINVQINYRLKNDYAELLKQVDEMNSFMIQQFADNELITTELANQPELDEPSIFNQDPNGFLIAAPLGAIAPGLIIFLSVLLFPIALTYLALRYIITNKTIDNLREFNSHINRLILLIKTTSA